MSTLNLSPKNPLVILALAGAAMWFITRRQVASAAVVTPAPVGARTVDGNTVSRVLSAVGALLSPSASADARAQQLEMQRELGAAAVKWGDPYYGGSDSATGSVPWPEPEDYGQYF